MKNPAARMTVREHLRYVIDKSYSDEVRSHALSALLDYSDEVRSQHRRSVVILALVIAALTVEGFQLAGVL